MIYVNNHILYIGYEPPFMMISPAYNEASHFSCDAQPGTCQCRSPAWGLWGIIPKSPYFRLVNYDLIWFNMIWYTSILITRKSWSCSRFNGKSVNCKLGIWGYHSITCSDTSIYVLSWLEIKYLLGMKCRFCLASTGSMALIHW